MLLSVNKFMKSKEELIVKSKINEIPVSKLKLGPTNPRFNHFQKKPTPEKMEKIIRQDDETYVLCEQILEAGIVTQELEINSKFEVIEGNRRLVCLRMILEDIKKDKLDKSLKEKFEKVRCKEISDEVGSKDMDMHLALIHVKGKKPWKKFNRANHIYRLNKIHDYSYDKIVSELGMGKPTVQRCVLVYKTLLDYSRKHPDDEKWFHKYTYFEYFFQRNDLKEFREDEKLVNEFMEWVYGDKFHDVRDIYTLAKILSDSDALETLRKENFSAATKRLDEKDPSLSNDEFKKIKDSVDAVNLICKMDPQEVSGNREKMKLLLKLESDIRNLMIDLTSKRELTIPN